MAGVYGFDVQRLNLSWSALEPTRGSDRPGLHRAGAAAVDQAAAHGIYTVLDMHQDTYSKYVTATAGHHLPAGRDARVRQRRRAGLGDARPTARRAAASMGRDLSPNVEQAFTNLYDDTDGIGAEFAARLGRARPGVRRRHRGRGYDLLNEPGPGNSPGVTSSLLLGRLYQQVDHRDPRRGVRRRRRLPPPGRSSSRRSCGPASASTPARRSASPTTRPWSSRRTCTASRSPWTRASASR